MANKRAVGNDYEEKAAEFLRQKNFLVLEQNFYSRWGEIDLVAKDGRYLVFAEVKYRRGNSHGNPLEAVDAKKQKKICRTASYYFVKNGYEEIPPCRFDVIAIMGSGEIVHIENAFEYKV